MRSVQKYLNDRNWSLVESIETLGKEKGGFSVSQISLAWLLSKEHITSPIIGPRSLEQLQDNMRAVEVKLTYDDLSLIDKLGE